MSGLKRKTHFEDYEAGMVNEISSTSDRSKARRNRQRITLLNLVENKNRQINLSQLIAFHQHSTQMMSANFLSNEIRSNNLTSTVQTQLLKNRSFQLFTANPVFTREEHLHDQIRSSYNLDLDSIFRVFSDCLI